MTWERYTVVPKACPQKEQWHWATATEHAANLSASWPATLKPTHVRRLGRGRRQSTDHSPTRTARMLRRTRKGVAS